MSATRVRAELRPVDTWHFGDGQPFAQADSGQAIARGLFPPLPSTCAGCVRLALAAAGGAVRGDWREQDRDEVVRLYGGGDGTQADENLRDTHRPCGSSRQKSCWLMGLQRVG